MSKSNSLENGILELILNNEPITLVGDASGIIGSTANGNLYVSLHTADPGEDSNQSTNEIAYTGYARVAVARNPGSNQWTVSGNQASNAAKITFPQCTGGSGTATHVGIGTDASGTGKLLYSAALTASRSISDGTTPEVAIGGITITED